MADQHGTRTDFAGTRTIRVFLSSTFRDMHAERDYLSRIVFPELRSRCRRRGADFVGIDLRWGVTEEEARLHGALGICLEEIEHCRPFFLCMLGERFGWVPPPEEVDVARFQGALTRGLPRDLADWYEFDETSIPAVYRLRRDRPMPNAVAEALARAWDSQGLPEAGLSITAREILRAAFAEDVPATHSFFYLREPGVTSDPGFPPALLPVFVEQDPQRQRQLAELCDRVRAAAGRFTVRDYRVAFAGVRLDPAMAPEGISAADRDRLVRGVARREDWDALDAPLRQQLERHGTVALEGVEALGDRVLEDLWRAIELELAGSGPPLDPHQRERAHHEAFVVERTRLFLGRDGHVDGLVAYVANDDDRQPLVVAGGAGSGKSALLAQCTRACRDRWPERVVLPYFIGAAPGSTSLPAALASLCRSALRACNLPESIPADPDELCREWLSCIERAAARRTIVLLIDAVNQLHSTTAQRQLGWIPATLPEGVRLVVSTVPGPELDALRARVAPGHVLRVPALSPDDCRRLVQSLLASRHKRLSEEQLDRLLDEQRRPEVGLPLYLQVAVEELSLFGSFAALDQRIDRLPPTLPELFEQVLMRLEQDHGRDVVEPVNAWLAVSRASLVEGDVLELLTRAGLPRRDRWVRLYRALETYLRPIEEESRSGALDFFHEQLRLAACRHYLQMPDPDATPSAAGKTAHETLALHFNASAREANGNWSPRQPVALGEIVFHRARAGWIDTLPGLFSDLDFLAVRAANGLAYSLLADFALAETFWPDSPERARLKRLAEYTRDLIAYARDPSRVVPPTPPPHRDLQAAPELGSAADLARVRAMRRFVTSHFDRLVAGEEPVAQVAYNSAQSGTAAEEAEWRLRQGLGPKGPWLRRLSRPATPRAAACLMTLRGHRNSIWSLAMTPDGTRALTGSWDGTIRVWDLSTGESRAFAAHAKYVLGVAIAADGRRAVSVSVGADDWADLLAWDLETGERRVVRHGIGSPQCVVLTPDGRRAATGQGDGEIYLFDLERDTMGSLRRHLAGVRALAMTPDSRWIVSGGGDRGLIVSDTSSGEHRECAPTLRNVRTLTITQDGRLAAAADRFGITVWDLASGSEAFPVPNGGGAVAITPDGTRLVCGGAALTVWDLVERTHRAIANSAGSNHLAIAADGSRAVSADHDDCVRVWALDGPAEEEDGPGRVESVVHNWAAAPGARAVYLNRSSRLEAVDVGSGEARDMGLGSEGMEGAVALVPPGNRLLRGGSHGLQLVDLSTGHATMLLEERHAGSAVRWLAVTPDGSRAVSASDDCQLRQWSLRDGTSRPLGSVRERVYSLTLAPDGRRAATGHGLGVVCLWDLETGERRKLEAVDDTPVAALSDDGGRLVAVTLGGRLVTWDLVNGTRRVELEDAGWTFRASPAGGLLVASKGRAPLRWLESGAPVREIGPADAEARTIQLSPDGRHVVIGRSGGGLRIQDLESGRPVACDLGSVPVRGVVFPRHAVLLDGGAPESFAVEGWTDTTLAPVLGVRLWQFGAFGVNGRRDAHVTVMCPGCGQRTAPAIRPDASASCPACGAGLRVVVVPDDAPIFPPVPAEPAESLAARRSSCAAPPRGVWRPRRDSRPGVRTSRAAAALPMLEPRKAEVPPEERRRPARQVMRRPRTDWVLLPYTGPSGRPWRTLRTPPPPPQ